MARQEISPSFNFPKEITEALLVKLEAEAQKTRSLRTAIAHLIEEEGLLFREMTERFFAGSKEVKIAVDEYVMVGTLILEAESALQSGIPQENLEDPIRNQVELLKEDSTGHALLTWWVNLGLKEFNRFPEREQRKAALIGRTNGVRRYRELYESGRKQGISA